MKRNTGKINKSKIAFKTLQLTDKELYLLCRLQKAPKGAAVDAIDFLWRYGLRWSDYKAPLKKLVDFGFVNCSDESKNIVENDTTKYPAKCWIE